MTALEMNKALGSSISSLDKMKTRMAQTYLSLRVFFLTRFAIFLLVILAGISPNVCAQQETKPTPASAVTRPAGGVSQTYKAEGISVEFNVQPASSDKRGNGELVAGSEATMSFKVVDTNSGKALTSLRPAAWVDQRQGPQPPAAKECREKIQAFLQPSFSKRPTVDLNSYFILALNHEPNISVIDPLSGFGCSKLYTLIALPSSGADWVMSADKKRLYVSMPQVNQVAVVDIPTWKVIVNLDAGINPTRVALQRDGRYLWIGNDSTSEKDSGVTVIDTVALKVVAQLKTGRGPHELVFNDDDSMAYVTNKAEGTLSVIDVRKLAPAANVKVGSLPASLVFSAFSRMIYVANEGDGSIVVLDGSRAGIVATMKAEAGLAEVSIPADSRFGFVVNPVRNMVYVFDLSANRLVHAVPVGPGSDQIAFTKQFAYIRSTGSEFVTMLKLADLGKEAPSHAFLPDRKRRANRRRLRLPVRSFRLRKRVQCWSQILPTRRSTTTPRAWRRRWGAFTTTNAIPRRCSCWITVCARPRPAFTRSLCGWLPRGVTTCLSCLTLRAWSTVSSLQLPRIRLRPNPTTSRLKSNR